MYSDEADVNCLLVLFSPRKWCAQPAPSWFKAHFGRLAMRFGKTILRFNIYFSDELPGETWLVNYELVFILKIRVCAEFPRDVAKMFFGSLGRNFQSDLEIIKSLFKKGWMFTYPLHTVTHSFTSEKIRKPVRINPKTF